MPVHIVVDSASDLDSARAALYGITVVPLVVSFGDTDYLDGVDIDNRSFYERLQASPVLPQTAAPSSQSFLEAYRLAIENGATGILSLHISSALSGTFSAACVAAGMLAEESAVPIEVIDSHTVSSGCALPAILAAGLTHNGSDLPMIAAFVRSLCDHSRLYFLVDTLTYLQKGGRIGKASALLGSALDIKPILTLVDGAIVPLERVRSRKKALARLQTLLASAAPFSHIALAISDELYLEEFLSLIRDVHDGPLEVFMLGAAVGVHVGPHAGGIFTFSQSV